MNFPLEQMAVCRQQNVSRVPSLSLLSHLLRVQGERGRVWERGVEKDSVFYMLSPDGDLHHSVKFLHPHFAR